VTMLPFFVYGTLRKGGSNYEYAFRNKVAKVEPAALHGVNMFEVGRGGAFPAIVVGKGTVQGDLIHVQENEYYQILKRVDALESEGALYERFTCTVELNDGSTAKAWVYVWCADPSALHKNIESGDWFQWETAKRSAPKPRKKKKQSALD
jgi:gamma-glutamylcyclotransferase (GGCT)/AIG2-like uncharacterized protein YtfP